MPRSNSARLLTDRSAFSAHGRAHRSPSDRGTYNDALAQLAAARREIARLGGELSNRDRQNTEMRKKADEAATRAAASREKLRKETARNAKLTQHNSRLTQHAAVLTEQLLEVTGHLDMHYANEAEHHHPYRDEVTRVDTLARYGQEKLGIVIPPSR